MSEEASPATPKEQLDTLITQARQSFEMARIQLAGQEGFIAGLLKAKELWDSDA